MESIFEQISTLLVEPSGSMVYHLVVAFIFISVLQPVLSFLPAEQKTQRKRVLIGVLLLIASRLILFVLALLSILNVDIMANTLPVAEKVINTLDIAIIVWLFAFQKAHKLGDIGLALFGLAILTGGIISTVYWSLQNNDIDFAQSGLATGWGVLTLLVLLSGIITLATSKSPARSQGIILCSLLLLAEGLQLLFLPERGDYFPISRLGHLVAFPLLVGILQNFQFVPRAHRQPDEETEEYSFEEGDFFLAPLPEDTDLFAEKVEEADEDSEESEVEETEKPLTQSLPLHLFKNGVALGGASDSQEICRLFTRFTAHALLADLCLLLTPPDNNGQVHLVCGYDLIVQETLEGASFDNNFIPRYKKLIDTGRPIHVLDQGTEKMYDFANLLQVDEVGNLLGYPIVDEEENKVVAVLALISPYSKRVWGADEQEYLNEAVKPISDLLIKATSPAKDEKSIQTLTQELELSETGRQRIEEEKTQLSAEVDSLKAKLVELPEVPDDIKDLQVQVKSLESALAVVETEKNELAENLIRLKEQNKALAEEQAVLINNDPEMLPQEVQARIDALAFANEELIRKNLELLEIKDNLKIEKEEWQKLQHELTERNKTLEEKRQEMAERSTTLEAKNKELAERTIALEEKNQGLSEIEKKFEELTKVEKQAADRITELAEENKALTKNLKNLQREHDKALKVKVEHEDQLAKILQQLEEALEHATLLENQLHESEASLQALKIFKSKTNGKAMPNEQSEVIASIAQELRQPMSSISGYTDLLISESVGILGALQKKFLERVKASTDRMQQLLDDLVQISTIDSGNFLFTLQPLELMDIIDLAIEATSAQFREKELSLRVNISPNLPKLHTDKDALHQILLHLMQNAGAATPSEGEIHLKAQLYDKSKEDVILLSVTDSGEGIPKDELPRVFSRLYRADNPLIQGVGDTGVGLSIAKTLTEALGGRIWVESGDKDGATYSVLLPITSPAVTQQEG